MQGCKTVLQREQVNGSATTTENYSFFQNLSFVEVFYKRMMANDGFRTCQNLTFKTNRTPSELREKAQLNFEGTSKKLHEARANREKFPT